RPSGQVIEDHQMSLFSDVVIWAVGYRLHEVLRNGDVHPLEFRHVKGGLGQRSRWNFSEELVVVGIQLFENGESSRCSDKVDAARSRIKLDFVGAADAIQRLNYFSRFRVHDDQLARFILMSAFDAATDEQPMMNHVQSGSMR